MCNNISSFPFHSLLSIVYSYIFYLANLTSFCYEFLCFAWATEQAKKYLLPFFRISAYYFHCFSNSFHCWPRVLSVLLLLLLCFLCLCLRIYLCIYTCTYIYEHIWTCMSYIICLHRYIYPPYACFFNLYVPIRLSWILLYGAPSEKKCLFSCSESWGTLDFPSHVMATSPSCLPLFNIQYALSSEMEKLCILNASNPKRHVPLFIPRFSLSFFLPFSLLPIVKTLKNTRTRVLATKWKNTHTYTCNLYREYP